TQAVDEADEGTPDRGLAGIEQEYLAAAFSQRFRAARRRKLRPRRHPDPSVMRFGVHQPAPRADHASRIRRSRFPASTRVSTFLAKWKRMYLCTGSLKKLDPGTAATPTSRAIHSQNVVSSGHPNSEISTMT